MFAQASSSEDAPALAGYIQSNLGHALRIWWAYFWPTTLIGFALTYLLELTVKVLFERVLVPAKVLVPIERYGGYVLTYVTAFFVLHYVLGKTFRHFRIGLLPREEESTEQELRRTFARTLRVWWTFTWRTVLYGLLGLVFVSYPMAWFLNIFQPGIVFTTLFFLLLGIVLNGAFSLFVIYSNILEEELGDFRVVLLPREKAFPAEQPLASEPAPLG